MADVLIVCGGTGGHLSPGIAMAERLTSRGYTCKLVISRKQVDSRLCRKYTDMDFVQAPGAPFSWRPGRLFRFGVESLRSFFFAVQLIRREQPRLILAFGGFLSVAPILVGWFLRIPIALHESNRVPGKAIRRQARFADRVYVPVGVRLRSMRPNVVRHLGYPLRREIRHIKKDIVRERMGVEAHAKVLVAFGGSQGAMVLNDWVKHNMEALARDGIHVFCVTGLGKGAEGKVEFISDGGERVFVSYIPFCDNVAEMLSCADLVVSRAGAGAIAELVRCLAPSILIPYPYAADQHQEANAAFIEQQGGAAVLSQDSIDQLYREVSDLIFNDWMLGRFRDNLRSLNDGRKDDAELIADDLEELMERFSSRRVLRSEKEKTT